MFFLLTLSLFVVLWEVQGTSGKVWPGFVVVVVVVVVVVLLLLFLFYFGI